ncbi:MAG: tetratricopeptide repeat protein [Armatimonadetes bacterium]|nr:tetratricopeptide repeat protein [Armatimonadota bacterium]
MEAVLGEAGGGAPLDALQRLAAASLIRRENDRGSAEDGPRFWMLETIREFAAEKLAGEARVGWEQAHARYFLALAEREAARLEGTAAPVAAAALALEQDNLLAALGTLQADPAREPAALQLLAALSAYWVRCCRHETARAYLPSGLTAAAAARQPRLYGQVLRALGTIAWQEGAYCEARDHLERALELARRVVDLPGAAGALQGLGALAADQERVDEARERLQETLTLRRQCNDRAGCVAALNNLGGLAAAAGDLAVAREQYDEALGLAQELDSAYLQGGVLASLGGLVLREGDAPTAERLYQASLGHFLACGHRTGEAHCLLRLARLAQQRGERETALRRAAESLAVWREIRHAQGIAGAEALHATLLTAPSPASVR